MHPDSCDQLSVDSKGSASLFGGRLGGFAIDIMVQVGAFASCLAFNSSSAVCSAACTEASLAAGILLEAVVSILFHDVSGVVQVSPVPGGGSSLAYSK